MNRTLAILALVVSAVYLPIQHSLPYPGDAALKTSMCVLLALLALRSKHAILAVALLFSASGDLLLAIDGTKLFVPALASFLVTHVLYAAIFVRAAKQDPITMSVWRRIGMIVPIVFAVAYSFALWPQLGELAMPVVIYITAIVAMTVLSFRVRQVLVPMGALLFMASDSLIAYGKFLSSAKWLGVSIWVSYALAQQLLAHGLLRSPGRGQSER